MSKSKRPSVRREEPQKKVNPKRITSHDLKIHCVPKADASIFEFEDFAYTFNAYESQPSVSAIYRITRDKRHHTLDQLRTCLFIEFRDKWKLGPQHFDEGSEEVEYLRLLITKIRSTIQAREVIRDALKKRSEEDE